MREKICCSFLFLLISISHHFFTPTDGWIFCVPRNFIFPAIDIIGGLITHKKCMYKVDVCAKGMRKKRRRQVSCRSLYGLGSIAYYEIFCQHKSDLNIIYENVFNEKTTSQSRTGMEVISD